LDFGASTRDERPEVIYGRRSKLRIVSPSISTPDSWLQVSTRLGRRRRRRAHDFGATIITGRPDEPGQRRERKLGGRAREIASGRAREIASGRARPPLEKPPLPSSGQLASQSARPSDHWAAN